MTRLSLSLFGGFMARLGEAPISGFKTDKTRALLAYLAIEMDRSHRRQTLAGLFWPGYLESSARANLRHALANLRQVLAESQNPIPFLFVAGETIQFNPTSDHWIDTEAFDLLMEADHTGKTAVQRLEQALDLYKGGFLEGFSLKDSPEFDTWSSMVREKLQHKALTAMYRLAEEYEGQGELDRACKYARRQLDLEPWSEDAHQQLMRLLAVSGQRSAALAQYAACRKTLLEILGVEPSEATKILFEQIRAGRVDKVEVRQGTMIKGDTSVPSQTEKLHHNLPAQPTSFIGRGKEIAAVSSMLAEHRLVTLTGTGGVGKTRLSIQLGLEILERYADGVIYIDLAPVSNPDLVLYTAALALGVRAEAEHLMEALVLALRPRDVLLVLDNCEHLLEASARLSDTILKTCPQVRILASSRTPLGVGGEAIYRVPSLTYPETPISLAVEKMLEFTAIHLLVERARLTMPDYQVTSQNAGALVRICQRLDGIPLALELAAARLNMLTAEQVADRLEHAFDLLSGGLRTGLPRHQTLRTTIEWSYHLLQEQDRLLLHRLWVFSGGFTLEAIEAVCAGSSLEASEILGRLTTLVNQSMVNARRKLGEETRYTLLDTVRQYAREQLADEVLVSLSDRHCAYYLWLAEQAEPRLRSAERLTWTKKIHQERLNMQQALEWAFSHGDPQAGIRIIVALAPRLWQPYEQTAQTVYWVKEGYKRVRGGLNIPPLLLIRLFICEIQFGFISGWIEDFRSRMDEVVALCLHVGPLADNELSFVLSLGVDYYSLQNDKTAAGRYIEQCLFVVKRLPAEDVWYKASAYYTISWAYVMYLKEYTLANQFALEGWQYFQQAGDRWFVTHLIVIGKTAQAEEDYKKAHQCFLEAFSVFREVNDLAGMFQSLVFLADLALAQGGPEWARHAARLMGAVEAVIGLWSIKDSWKNDRADFFYPQTMINMRKFLDPHELEVAWSEGAAMSIEEASRYMLAEHFAHPTKF